ncbi:MAG: hypothetical protein Q4G63_10020 [Bacteroidia bacterium]|nr:hypothetical protein [Bacteroidia bacterium]
MTKKNASSIYAIYLNSLRGVELYDLITAYIEANTGEVVDLDEIFTTDITGAIAEIEEWVENKFKEDEKAFEEMNKQVNV